MALLCLPCFRALYSAFLFTWRSTWVRQWFSALDVHFSNWVGNNNFDIWPHNRSVESRVLESFLSKPPLVTAARLENQALRHWTHPLCAGSLSFPSDSALLGPPACQPLLAWSTVLLWLPSFLASQPTLALLSCPCWLQPASRTSLDGLAAFESEGCCFDYPVIHSQLLPFREAGT